MLSVPQGQQAFGGPTPHRDQHRGHKRQPDQLREHLLPINSAIDSESRCNEYRVAEK